MSEIVVVLILFSDSGLIRQFSHRRRRSADASGVKIGMWIVNVWCVESCFEISYIFL